MGPWALGAGPWAHGPWALAHGPWAYGPGPGPMGPVLGPWARSRRTLPWPCHAMTVACSAMGQWAKVLPVLCRANPFPCQYFPCRASVSVPCQEWAQDRAHGPRARAAHGPRAQDRAHGPRARAHEPRTRPRSLGPRAPPKVLWCLV